MSWWDWVDKGTATLEINNCNKYHKNHKDVLAFSPAIPFLDIYPKEVNQQTERLMDKKVFMLTVKGWMKSA